MRHTSRTILSLAALALVLSGCSVKDEPTAAAPDDAAPALTLLEGWAKATEEPMTGVFGTLTNTTAEDIHLVGVESEVAGMAELHVTVDDGAGGRLMKEAEDGFVIPAGGEHVLEPGGDHLMLMQLNAPIATGEDVELTLLDATGKEYAVSVTARAFSGAEEHYVPGHGDGASSTTEAP